MEIVQSTPEYLIILKHAMSAYSWPIIFLVCSLVFIALAFWIPLRVRADWPKSTRWMFGIIFGFAGLLFLLPWVFVTGSKFKLTLDKPADLIKLESTYFLVYSSVKTFKLHDLKDAEIQTDRSAYRLVLVMHDGDIEYPLSAVFDQQSGYFEVREKINQFLSQNSGH